MERRAYTIGSIAMVKECLTANGHVHVHDRAVIWFLEIITFEFDFHLKPPRGLYQSRLIVYLRRLAGGRVTSLRDCAEA